MLTRGRERLEKNRQVVRSVVSELARGDTIHRERIKGAIFTWLCLLATLVGIVSLAALLVYLFHDAAGWVDLQFLTSSPSRFAERAGIRPMLLGSIYVVSLVAVFSLPLGVGAAIYLEEYARNTLFKKAIEMNIANLAGVPSIVYGLLGLGLFVTTLGMRHGIVLVGALTLTLRVLPIVIVSSQEAVRAVPDSLRHASLGIGATRWQMIRSVVLVRSLPGIMTGTILALANAMGETAPLIMIGAATSIFTAPRGIMSPFSALPLQIYAWSDFPAREFQRGVTPAAIVVLLGVLLSMNAVAIYLRNRFSRNR
jgi:phosphate transport system permease protein